MQVHHIIPFHSCVALGRSDLELDPRNLITLREKERGHPGQYRNLALRHLGDFQSANLAVEQDARVTFHGLPGAAIRQSQAWALDEMSAREEKRLRELRDWLMPVVGQGERIGGESERPAAVSHLPAWNKPRWPVSATGTGPGSE